MSIRNICFSIAFLFKTLTVPVQENTGATIPWTTYEAENMQTTGTVLGPVYEPYRVETESSGQKCVKLNAKNQYVAFQSASDANSMVIRFSLPDSPDGIGTRATIGIYINKKLKGNIEISSHNSWLYGKYPFTNDPAAGAPRHFYDEARIKDIKISKGDQISIRWEDRQGDNATYCIIDLVDLENIAPPVKAPANSLSITDKRFSGADLPGFYTNALRKCIEMAAATGKTVWIPAGTFKIDGDITLRANTRMRGAGMWYTELAGDSALYTDPNKRVRLVGAGSNIHISDFAITGKLNYRVDRESNDGITGSYGENSTISRIWIEHTKVGMWIENSRNLQINGCRMRNTMADGINFCTGMANSVIANCTTRGTGDDCFAIWPTIGKKQVYSPGHNLVIHCTGQLPYLANGAAIYGGDSNIVKDCSFTDISQGSAILVSTTFPTESKDKSIDNNFTGTTLVENCTIQYSGGL